MGKASRWIRNFLLGKRDEKDNKKINTSILSVYVTTSGSLPPPAPKIKRRWSFGKSPAKGKAHKLSRSMDSAETTQLVMQAKTEFQLQRDRSLALLAIARDKHAAATKIQAAFRSYLARKALCALRSLVKLQALVRGFLVRKQTTATIRCMHALMSIQVRARVQRIQMAEEAQAVVPRLSSVHRNLSQDGDNRKVQKEPLDRNLIESCQVSKSKSGYFNRPKVQRRIEQGFTTYFSGDVSVVRQGQQYEEYFFSSAQNTPRDDRSVITKTRSTRASFTFHHTDTADSASQNYALVPHYMAKTESSRAKTRSQSEPKQRPKRSAQQKSKRTPPVDGTSIQLETQSRDFAPGAKLASQENQEPWFKKLYKSRRSLKDSESDATTSKVTSHSNYSRSLIGYEV
ncbi:hypothetical protein NL676_020288 [Syzygium grande]|nr:hypothetical protein NL676_020288 [Syzygium grande]